MQKPNYSPEGACRKQPDRLSWLPQCLLLLLLGLTHLAHAQQPARKADDFVNSIGVNTHFTYTDKPYFYAFDEVKVKLGNLGVRHIRDGITTNPDIYNKMKELYNTYGIRMVQLVNTHIDSPTPWNGPLDTSKIDAELDKLKTLFLQENEAIEGPNEYDLNFGNETATDPDWPATLRLYTKTLWEKVQADPVLRSRPVIAPSMGQAFNAPNVGNMSGWFDYGNMHSYPGGVHPSAGLEDYNIPNTRKIAGNRIIWATETGYHNALDQPNGGHYPAPENVTAKFGPRMVAEYFRVGMGRTYFYEFLNEGTNMGNLEDNFGLIRNDLSEKPIYWSLKAMIDLLKDPGTASFEPGTLDYSLSGDLTNVRQVLLQKSNGKFYLLVWQEVPSYDREARTEIPVADRPLTLNLNGNIAQAAIYLPTTNGAPATSTVAGPMALSLAVPDQLMIVELTPQAAPDLVVKDIQWSPASLTAGTPVTFSAVVKNQGSQPTPAGTAVTVHFSVDSTAVAASANYTGSIAPGDSVTITADSGSAWTSTFGAHTVEARVNQGNTLPEISNGNNTFRKGICVSGGNGEAATVVSIVSPVQNETFNEGATVFIQASVGCGTDVAKVAFFDGTTKLGEDTTAPYTFEGNQLAGGNHSVTAKVLAGNGQVISTSAPVTFTIINLPDLVISRIGWTPANPKAGTSVTFNATVKNIGKGATPAGTVIGVAFFVNGGITNWSDTFNKPLAAGDSVVLTANGGVNGGSPSWTSVGGLQTISAFVDDVNRIEEKNNNNNTFQTTACIGTEDGSPFLAFAQPVERAEVALGDTSRVSVSAADCDGSVAKVVLYDGPVKIGELTAAPYDFVWTVSQAGEHQLIAQATDNQGKTAADTITVTAATRFRFQAEEALVTNARVLNKGAASGGKSVGYIDFDDSSVAFSVYAAQAGSFRLNVWYANGMGSPSSHTLAVNGAAAGTVDYPATPNWDVYQKVTRTISLQQGANSLKFGKGTLFAELDVIEVLPIDSAVLRLEAEAARITNAEVVGKRDASNGQAVGRIDFEDSAVEFTATVPKAGKYTLTARYANGMGAESSHQLSVNGGEKITIAYPATANWEVYGTAQVEVTLPAGTNRLTFTRGTLFAELDVIELAPVPNALPEVAFTAPAANAVVYAGEKLTLKALASDPDGSVVKVEFFANGMMLGETSTSPYSIQTDTLAAGNYSLLALATDNASGVAADTIRIVVKPAVAITSFTLVDADTDQDIREIKNGDVINLKDSKVRNVTVRANATTSVARVDFTLNKWYKWRENAVPFALFADNGKGDYYGIPAVPGSYQLAATPYRKAGSQFVAGKAITVNFKLVKHAPGREGLAEEELSTMEVYPNPVHSQFTLSFPEVPTGKLKITLYDGLGKRVVEQAITPDQEGKVRLHNLIPQSGVYLLRVVTDQGKVYTAKVVKE